MRLIDADKIGLTDFEIIMCDVNYKKALEMLIDKIENAPIVNAVEIVRCKNCKHRDAITKRCIMLDNYYTMNGIKVLGNGRHVADDFYCALGVEE